MSCQLFRIKLIHRVLLSGIIGTTILAFVSSFWGWNIILELLAHFQRQYLILVIFLFGLLLLTRPSKKIISIGLFCLSILLANLVYWYIPQSVTGSDRYTNLRVLIANIHIDNRSYAKVLSFIEKSKPDLVFLIEVNNSWTKPLEILEGMFPYAIGKDKLNNLEMVVYSKVPLENTSLAVFENSKKVTFLGDLIIDNRMFSLIAAHSLPPFKPEFFDARNQQLEKISEYIQTRLTPVIAIGDFNITMWSPYYKRFTNQTKLINGRKGFGILPTWPAKARFSHLGSFMSFWLSIPIDHCLISREIKVANMYTGPNLNSDHRPLIIDLLIPTK